MNIYFIVYLLESEHVECRPPGQAMEVPDHNGVGYSRGPQSDTYRSRGQLQRHHTIQTCDDAYVSKILRLILWTRLTTFCYGKSNWYLQMYYRSDSIKERLAGTMSHLCILLKFARCILERMIVILLASAG